MGERAGSIAGIVLAAGSSGRMGTNKLLLRLADETLLRRTVRRTVEARLEPVIVVLGHEADRVQPELAGLPCHSLVNRDHARGMSSSLRAGLAAVPPEAIAAVVVLADMPLVTSAMIEELAVRYRRGAAPLVVSEYGRVLAPPMLYDRALFAELEAVQEHETGKSVAHRHRTEAIAVPCDPTVLLDLDVPADYERAEQVEEGGSP